ncbi:oligopeptide/dipeptide ABC transporter, ATP-binding protein [Methanolobus tindarius DSM 2278]|uniref:Oligopeptide/dipeptide ABC transporter, ATP-binding protein n=1 Tax=Methanolobus tindarius DSM 2278 TaxID=1090322 RepID=W9DPM0_METTI|nr:ABC transporter ATP-binding protein [Methanolobus tindarius]ETA67213.1 oligopeptide/dipeptide ABC transporter, ATP-binding protein [Methanolobus tindarius DSM 2278]
MLEVCGLKKTYTAGTFRKSHIKAIDDVTFHINKGETFGIVGESGCGKSTLGRCILRLTEPTSGKIVFNDTEISSLSKESLRTIRPKMQMIFQDPDSSLNPRKTIGKIIAEPLVIMGMDKELIENKVKELIRHVGLLPEHIDRFPHQLSGGQNQRAVLARALALEPVFIVADEPTASLDVSVQAQILNLLKKLKEEYGLTMLFISHDLELVKHMCDRIAVMYMGNIIETASIVDIFREPTHPFTCLLLDGDNNDLEQNIDTTVNKDGCHYYTNCPVKTEKCLHEKPELKLFKDGHSVACHNTRALPIMKNT